MIYGIEENGNVPQRIDNGFDPTVISKEWLEQVINSRIQRRIDGVRVNQIELAKSAPGRVAYVVSIPQSTRAPHQASDKKFYKRFNFESVAMEEYEVRDVSRRSESPDLHIQYKVELLTSHADQSLRENRVKVVPLIFNEAPTPANYAVINICIDKQLNIHVSQGFNINGEQIIVAGDEQIPVTCLHMNHGIQGNIPIFEGTKFRLTDSLILGVPAPGRYIVVTSICAPAMPKRLTVEHLTWDGTNIVIEHDTAN